ncbi:MAG: Uncharacterised protein [Candidatus Poseidoniaceae archaeon]|nr:MAG: Uncharacterised protein [Candidatus Poseidoniaceae archaeon]
MRPPGNKPRFPFKHRCSCKRTIAKVPILSRNQLAEDPHYGECRWNILPYGWAKCKGRHSFKTCSTNGLIRRMDLSNQDDVRSRCAYLCRSRTKAGSNHVCDANPRRTSTPCRDDQPSQTRRHCLLPHSHWCSCTCWKASKIN